MTNQIKNDIKEIYQNSINNYSSDLTKNQLPVSNINTNSFSQENLFNELINSTNCLESKNNSSFYNFSESIHSNSDNPNIIMNKDQLYQTFILFQKFLNQNILNSNNNSGMNSNNISPNKNENQKKYKTIYKISNKDNNNIIDEINEINEFEDNDDEDNENKDQSNGKIMSKKSKTEQKSANNNIKMNIENNDNHKDLNETNSHHSIKNGKEVINNGGNENILIIDENKINEKDKDKDLLYKDDDLILQLNNNLSFQQRNNSDNIKNNETKNSYDDIPIKYNKVKFIDLVEKKLADEKKYKYIDFNDMNKNNKIEDEKIKEQEENTNQILNNNINYKKVERKDRIDLDKDNIIIKNKKNNINNNYSFDRDETKILNENKNILL